MPISALYDPPFTDDAAGEPEDLFSDAEIEVREAVLRAVDATAELPEAGRTT